MAKERDRDRRDVATSGRQRDAEERHAVVDIGSSSDDDRPRSDDGPPGHRLYALWSGESSEGGSGGSDLAGSANPEPVRLTGATQHPGPAAAAERERPSQRMPLSHPSLALHRVSLGGSRYEATAPAVAGRLRSVAAGGEGDADRVGGLSGKAATAHAQMSAKERKLLKELADLPAFARDPNRENAKPKGIFEMVSLGEWSKA